MPKIATFCIFRLGELFESRRRAYCELGRRGRNEYSGRGEIVFINSDLRAGGGTVSAIGRLQGSLYQG